MLKVFLISKIYTVLNAQKYREISIYFKYEIRIIR